MKGVYLKWTSIKLEKCLLRKFLKTKETWALLMQWWFRNHHLNLINMVVWVPKILEELKNLAVFLFLKIEKAEKVYNWHQLKRSKLNTNQGIHWLVTKASAIVIIGQILILKIFQVVRKLFSHRHHHNIEQKIPKYKQQQSKPLFMVKECKGTIAQ